MMPLLLLPIILLVVVIVPMTSSMPVHRLGGGDFSDETMLPSGCGDAPPSSFAFATVATMARADGGPTVKGGRGDTGAGPYRLASHHHHSFSSLPFLAHDWRRLLLRMDAVATVCGGDDREPLIILGDDDDDTIVPEYDSLLLVPGRHPDEVLERLCGPSPRSLRVIDRAVRHLNEEQRDRDRDRSSSRRSSPLSSVEGVVASLSHLPKPGYEIVLIGVAADAAASRLAESGGETRDDLRRRREGEKGVDVAVPDGCVDGDGDGDGGGDIDIIGGGRERPFPLLWDVVPSTSTIVGVRDGRNLWHGEPNGRPRGAGGSSMPPKEPSATVLELAHAALDLARHRAYDEEGGDGDGVGFEDEDEEVPTTMDDIVRRAEERLLLAQGTDLCGRLAPDAAYAFALAGVTSTRLYDALATVSSRELRRVGRRTSFGVRHVLHMVEKLAAAGYRGDGDGDGSASSSYAANAQRAYDAAADCLEMKRLDDEKEEEEKRRLVESLRSGDFDLCSPSHRRSPLWLWRFSSKQKKRTEPHSSTTAAVDTGEGFPRRFWAEQFDNPTRPLVVDVGCGMGVSLLGLATVRKRSNGAGDDIDDGGGRGHSAGGRVRGCDDGPLGDVDWSTCNFLGADVNGLFVGYANGIASRWGASDRLRFWIGRSEEAMRRILDRRCPYPGGFALVMVQFPTPFRFGLKEGSTVHRGGRDRDGGRSGDPDGTTAPTLRGDGWNSAGNSQLPEGPSRGFMVSTKLLRLIGEVLRKSDGKLLLQSNCEDVAISVMNTAVQLAGFECLHVPEPVEEAVAKEVCGDGTLRKRQANWVNIGGERACGREWSCTSLVPPRGVTETEVSCHLDGVPVHRCILKPR